MKLKLLLCILALSVGLYAAPPRNNPPSRGHGNSGHATERPRATRPEHPGRSAGHDQRKRDETDAKDRQRRDKRYENGRRNAQRHWDGHRFDHRFFALNFGRYHPFFMGGPGFYWYGNPCLYTSQFLVGDVYFQLNYPCSDMWVGYPWEGVYIDESPDGEGYVLVNPNYPGVTFGVRVVF